MIPHFTYPWALLLLLLAPLLAWRYAQSSRGAWRFPDLRLLPMMRSRRARLATWGGLVLRVGILSLAIIALSGPRWPNEDRIPTEGISIAMVVDVSVSMGEEDFAWQGKNMQRLSGVKQVFRLFVAGGDTPDGASLPGRPNDLIALVTFATHPETACPLTLDHTPLLKIVDDQAPRIAATEGTTNPGDAIAWALHVLQKAPTKRRVVVFLTDGEANVPEKLKPRQAAQLAANLSIPIYTIDASPEPRNKEEADEVKRAREMMQTIARMTEGDYFRAQDGRGLAKAYESIDRVERERILSFQYRRFHEGFAWFALAALACCLALAILETTVWRRVP
jgi:Ca-activated chloride channel homolog